MKKFALLFVFIFSIFSLQSQKDGISLADGWSFDGQTQVMPFFDGRDFNNDTYMTSFTSSKFRIGIGKTLGDNVKFYVQMQDSRILGQNDAVVSRASTTFLNQGFIELGGILGQDLALQAGRFQMIYGDGRFIHESPWNYIGRAFDGFRAKYKFGSNQVDAFWTKHSTRFKGQVLAAAPSNYSTVDEPYTDYDIIGAVYDGKFSPKSNLQLLVFFENNSNKSNGTDKDLARLTTGLSYYGNYDALSVKLEAGYQSGSKSDKDIGAYTTVIEGTYDIEPVKLLVGFDMFSGTAPEDQGEKINTYDDYLAAKHRFYGDMDYFVTARAGNGLLGVNDIRAGAFLNTADKKWMFKLMAHYFIANQESSSGETAFGQEFDFVARYILRKGIFVEWGAGVFLPGELMKEIYSAPGVTREDPGFSSFFRFVVNLK